MSSDRLQPLHLDPSALHGLPEGWVWKKVEDATHAIPVGRKYDGKAVVPGGSVPVIDQSLSGVMGHHNDEPGVQASHTDPAFTFANHTCAMRWMTSPFSCIQNVFVLRGREGVSTQYLYYATQGRVVLEEYKGHAPVFRSMFIPVAPLDEQENIAHLLAALDDRIALLRETNATLEAIAQALFKSWFVDFDPVRAKQQGLAPAGMDEAAAPLFPDSFEESALGLVPKGWLVGILGDIARTAKNQVQPSELHSAINYVGLEHIPRKSLSLVNWETADGLESAKARFSEGDVLFGKLRPYFHKVIVAPFVGVCSTDILVCQAEQPAYYGVVVMHLFSTALIDYADRLSNGAKMPRIGWRDIAAYPVVVPTEHIAALYTEAIAPVLGRMKANLFQAQTLVTLRDTLLPRLISGQLRLPEAQATTEAALDGALCS